jgi:hypothetical protein
MFAKQIMSILLTAGVVMLAVSGIPPTMGARPGGERTAFADKGTLMSFIGPWVQMRGEHERLS